MRFQEGVSENLIYSVFGVYAHVYIELVDTKLEDNRLGTSKPKENKLRGRDRIFRPPPLRVEDPHPSQ